MQAWLFWLIIAILAFVFEAATVGLVSVWFGISATITSIFAAVGNEAFGESGWFLPLQFVIFAVISGILLMLTRPIASKMIKTNATNAESIIGKSAIVTEDINNIEGTGQIKLSGSIWSAKSSSGEIIEKDKIVIIKNIAGVSAIVESADNQEV